MDLRVEIRVIQPLCRVKPFHNAGLAKTVKEKIKSNLPKCVCAGCFFSKGQKQCNIF